MATVNLLDKRFSANEILITENGKLKPVMSALMSCCASNAPGGAREQVALTLKKTRRDNPNVRLSIVERGACWKATDGKRSSLMRIANA